MPFNTRTGGQQDIAQQGYTELRVLKGERRGKFFKNPVSLFNVVSEGAGNGVSVFFKVAFTRGVQSIQILRGQAASSRDPGSANILQTYVISPLQTASIKPNVTVSYVDNLAGTRGASWYYWLRINPLHSTFQPLLAGPVLVAIT